MIFRDRRDAGRQLAEALAHYKREDCIIMGLPRGGVVVAYEVAKLLEKPLDVLVIRKIGLPGHEELAAGAIGPDNVMVLNPEVMDRYNLTVDGLRDSIMRESRELDRRLERYRGNRPFPNLEGKTVIIVDDGLATGATARAAIETARALHAGKVVLAVPVGAYSTVAELRYDVDELVCLSAPDYFQAVSLWYEYFPQNSDTEVISLLQSAWSTDPTARQLYPG